MTRIAWPSAKSLTLTGVSIYRTRPPVNVVVVGTTTGYIHACSTVLSVRVCFPTAIMALSMQASKRLLCQMLHTGAVTTLKHQPTIAARFDLAILYYKVLVVVDGLSLARVRLHACNHVATTMADRQTGSPVCPLGNA